VLDHLCFLGKLKDKGHSSNDAATALLLFDNSAEKVYTSIIITSCVLTFLDFFVFFSVCWQDLLKKLWINFREMIDD